MLLTVVARETPANASQVQAASVQSVRVTVESAAPMPEPLRARIETSVTRVAERVMLGQPVALVQGSKDELARVIRDVFAAF